MPTVFHGKQLKKLAVACKHQSEKKKCQKIRDKEILQAKPADGNHWLELV
jgi:hypothetical protein